jgi:hypothetical protein
MSSNIPQKAASLAHQVEIANTLVDIDTGECIDEVNAIIDRASPGRAISLADLFVGERPRHIQELSCFEPLERPKWLARFTGTTPELVTDHLNKPLGITGAILYWSGPYKSLADNTWQEGYYTMLFRTSTIRELNIVTADKNVITVKRAMVLKCSGKYLAEWGVAMMDSFGWYDWRVTVPVVFTQGSDNGVRVTPIEVMEEEA